MQLRQLAIDWTPFVGDQPLDDVVRTLATGVLAYVAIVVLLRTSGKRTLSKLNAFDLVVSVAIGSVLANTLVSRTTSVVEGVTAVCVLAGGQYAIAWLSVRFRLARKLVRSAPATLVRDGSIRHEVLDRQRVTAGELSQAVRSAGFGGLDAVGAVILETDGTLSVIGVDDLGDRSALVDGTVGP